MYVSGKEALDYTLMHVLLAYLVITAAVDAERPDAKANLAAALASNHLHFRTLLTDVPLVPSLYLLPTDHQNTLRPRAQRNKRYGRSLWDRCWEKRQRGRDPIIR
eukprot:739488-Rhodomonas_salina.1